jgi:uracil phosphoribosyltransferase
VVSSVHVSQHPLVLDALGRLRDAATQPPLFRTQVRNLTKLLFIELATQLRVEPVTVRTPLADCASHRLCERVALVPVLRAGLGMIEAILEMLPAASVWHLGLYRDHDTALPVVYYNKLHPGHAADVTVVLDPMLATGGSAIEAVALLRGCATGRVFYLGLIAAPEGVEALRKAHPDVEIYLGAIDSHLNEQKYIVPGLGDAGDRQFATL